MSQVLQVRCPKCKSVLRVPAEWLNKPMRCKHCQQVFQGQAPPSGPAKPESKQARQSPRGPRPASRSFVKQLPVLLLLLALGGGLAFGGNRLWVVLQGSPGSAESVQIAQVDPKPEKTPKKRKKIRVEDPKVDPPKEDPGMKDPPKEDPTKKDPPKEDPAKKDPPKEDPTKKDPPKEDPTKKDPPKEDPTKKDPPKEDPTKKDPPKKKEDPKEMKPPVVVATRPPTASDPYPRRALIISINDYLFWNPVHYGSPATAGNNPAAYPGSSTDTVVSLLPKGPFHIRDDQITELSDGMATNPKAGRRPREPVKQVVETTLDTFLNSSRIHDRLMVFFVGHMIDVEKECYLVPFDGNKDDVKTLIPLTWVYERMSKCKARQKVLVLDVCRFSPGRGKERPVGMTSDADNDMSDQIDAMLLSPPPGVQVWCSCIKGQKSIELDKGGVFMQALCGILQKGIKGGEQHTDTLPLAELVPEVNQRLKELLDPQKLVQASRLVGSELDNGAVFNPDDKMPDRLVILPPKVEGDDIASFANVKEVMDELDKIPPVKTNRVPLKALPPFSGKILVEYKADYFSWDALTDIIASQPEKYPLRKAVLKAIVDMELSQQIVMQERIISPKGMPLDPKTKGSFIPKQQDAALKAVALQDAFEEFEKAGQYRDKETKRWQAHYDFTLARMQSRVVFLHEYNYLLGIIRLDMLPDLQPGVHNGWRLASFETPKITTKEAKIKALFKQINKGWRRVIDEHPGTPWAVLAARERLTAVGLEWRASRD